MNEKIATTLSGVTTFDVDDISLNHSNGIANIAGGKYQENDGLWTVYYVIEIDPDDKQNSNLSIGDTIKFYYSADGGADASETYSVVGIQDKYVFCVLEYGSTINDKPPYSHAGAQAIYNAVQ